MRDQKKIIEAALFIAARPMSLAELYHIVGIPKPQIKKLLDEMEKEYDDHGLSVRERNGYFELHIKEEYKSHVQHLAPEKDFSKATLQTLSLIAYHNPAKQSFVIETRGNRAYDHIKELSSRGFIRLEPEGHTNRIHVTKKFLEYFDLTSQKELKKYFSQRGIEPPDEEEYEERAGEKENDEPVSNVPELSPEKENLPKKEPAPEKEIDGSAEEIKDHKNKEDIGDAAEKEETETKEEQKEKKKTQIKKSVNIKDEPYKSQFSDVIKDDSN